MSTEPRGTMRLSEWNRECDRLDAQASSVRQKVGRGSDVGRMMTLRWMIAKGRRDLEPLYAQALRDTATTDEHRDEPEPVPEFGWRAPSARGSDPSMSHAAARRVAAGNSPMIEAIRAVLTRRGSATAFEVADDVLAEHGDRWDEGSIRSACARAGLRQIGESVSPRGVRCAVWELEDR